jgi:hypothetical protein
VLQLFARWLPAPFVPSDLGAAGATLAEAEDADLDATTAASRHRSEAQAALGQVDKTLDTAAQALRRLGREVAVREAQLEATSAPPRPGDA